MLSRVCLGGARTLSLWVSVPKKVLARFGFGWGVWVMLCPTETLAEELSTH